MNWLTIVGIALGLAMDAFAVAVIVGSMPGCFAPRPLFRLSFHFGLFQFMMPVVGWYLGSRLDQYLQSIDHWVAFGLLVWIGGRMVFQSFRDRPREVLPADPTRKWSLVGLSVATSIDALAVGFSMAFLGVAVWTPSIIIGVVAAAMTAIGMVLGCKLGPRLGKHTERIGGLILIAIGIKIVLEHTMSI
jgi:putative Mn2+ efflux pump MntP